MAPARQLTDAEVIYEVRAIVNGRANMGAGLDWDVKIRVDYKASFLFFLSLVLGLYSLHYLDRVEPLLAPQTRPDGVIAMYCS